MNVFELMATLSLNSRAYEEGLNHAENDAQKSSSSLTSKFAGASKKIAGYVAKGAAAAVTAVAGITTASVKGYATYEQLVGGVQKLYGAAGMTLEEYAKSVGESTSQASKKYKELTKAQTLVMKNAQNAFATAGMSANEYMDTATQFSASLVNSLGGDTVKAAEYTDTAMRAISDNVNTFGSNMEDVSNAFKGFSKQNYTMLDNLKLGYGGTKEEMQRLIDDANAYGKANGEASNLSINSFADIVTAIQQVQEKQQIANTTVNESEKTIEGSFNAMKAAWSNLVTGFADPDQDLGTLIDNAISSAQTFGDNIIPRFQEAISGISEAVETALPEVLEQIPAIIEEFAPGIIDTASSVLATVATTAISMFTEQLPTLIQYMQTASSDMVAAGAGMITNIGAGLSQGLPQLLAKALPMVLQFAQNLRANAGQLVNTGLNFILQLGQGIANSLPTLITYVPQIITEICGIINDNMPKILATGVALIVELGAGLIQAIPTIVANIPNIITAIVSVFTAFNWVNLGSSIIKTITSGIKSMASSAPQALSSIGKTMMSGFKGMNWTNLGSTVLKAIVAGIKALAKMVPQALKTIGKSAINGFKSIDWVSLGSNIVAGIIKGIGGAAGSLYNKLKNLAGDALGAAKKKLKIESPSKEFANKVGKWIPAGIALGIEKNKMSPLRALQDLSDDMVTSDAGLVSVPRTKTTSTDRLSSKVYNVTFNVDGAEDPEEWGKKCLDELENYVRLA